MASPHLHPDWLGIAQTHLTGERRLNEMNTQRLVIEPVLAASGVNVWDLATFQEQVSVASRSRAVRPDYALLDGAGRTVALIEAKKLWDEDVLSRGSGYLHKLLGAARSHPDQPRLCVLTNGQHWVLADARRTVRPHHTYSWDAVFAVVDVLRGQEHALLQHLPAELHTKMWELSVASAAKGSHFEGPDIDDALRKGASRLGITRPRNEPAERVPAPLASEYTLDSVKATGMRPTGIRWAGSRRSLEYWTEVLPALVRLLGERAPRKTVRLADSCIVASALPEDLREPTSIDDRLFVERALFPIDIIAAARAIAAAAGLRPTELFLTIPPPVHERDW